MAGNNSIKTVSHIGVCKGICVLMFDDLVIYAGPINEAPELPELKDKQLFLNPDDFRELNLFLEKRKLTRK